MGVRDHSWGRRLAVLHPGPTYRKQVVLHPGTCRRQVALRACPICRKQVVQHPSPAYRQQVVLHHCPTCRKQDAGGAVPLSYLAATHKLAAARRGRFGAALAGRKDSRYLQWTGRRGRTGRRGYQR